MGVQRSALSRNIRNVGDRVYSSFVIFKLGLQTGNPVHLLNLCDPAVRLVTAYIHERYVVTTYFRTVVYLLSLYLVTYSLFTSTELGPVYFGGFLFSVVSCHLPRQVYTCQ